MPFKDKEKQKEYFKKYREEHRKELLQKKQLANALGSARLFMLKRNSTAVRLERINTQNINRAGAFSAKKEPFLWDG